MGWERVWLGFARGLRVRFCDRDVALGRLLRLAEEGGWSPWVVYGPEGCGKTSLFRQAVEVFRGCGYSVVWINPLSEDVGERIVATEDVRDLIVSVMRDYGGLPESLAKLVDVGIAVAYRVLRRRVGGRLVVFADDIFQAVGLDRAETYVKALLNLVEHPPGRYEKVAIVIATSEGVSRERVGRHSWAYLYAMWNMPKEGFRELYEQIPGDKPSFEDVWRWTGGNPRFLGKLYEVGWNVDRVVGWLIRGRSIDRLVAMLPEGERDLLAEAVYDPDVLWENLARREAQDLVCRLIERNLIMEMFDRVEDAWIDVPPPERDLDLGIGRRFAWQTPLHREAVRRVLNV